MTILKIIEEFKESITGELRLLAIDYGKKKVGLAISGPHNMSLPYKIIANNGQNLLCAEINKHIISKKINGIIIGIPVSMRQNNESEEIILNFAKNLAEIAALPIFLQDERRTTRAADSLLKIAGYNRKERNNIDDAVAASLILESVLAKLINL